MYNNILKDSKNKKTIDLVIDKYIKSSDFNGLPMEELESELQINTEELRKRIKSLIINGILEVSLSSNPHIKIFDSSVKAQIDFFDKKDISAIVLYPSRIILSQHINQNDYIDRPFSRMLLLGYPQLHSCHFDLSVLERYRNDPRYELTDDGTTLGLEIKGEFYIDDKIPEEDKIGIQGFGYAYTKKEKQRVVAVFLRYLHDLSSRHQKHWESHQVSGQFLIDRDYYKRSFLGEFTDNRSIYEAFLEEEKQINIICKIMKRTPLFKKEYNSESLKDFSCIIRPTENELVKFAHLLDKLISENIDKDFFQNDINLKDENEKDIGTINLIKNWLEKLWKPNSLQVKEAAEGMFKTFRKIRKLRQKPAHAILTDKHDIKYYDDQSNLIESAYLAMRTLRQIFSGYPTVIDSTYRAPDWLQDGQIKF